MTRTLRFKHQEVCLSDIQEFATKMKNYAFAKDITYLQFAQELESVTEEKMVKSKCSQRQTTLDSFFKK